jgi:hypothetical protein
MFVAFDVAVAVDWGVFGCEITCSGIFGVVGSLLWASKLVSRKFSQRIDMHTVKSERAPSSLTSPGVK